MNFFGSRKKKGDTVLLFDIGSVYVGASIVHVVPGEKSRVIWCGREPIPFQSSLNHTRLVTLMVASLENLIRKVVHEAIPQIDALGLPKLNADRILCFLCSPWYVSASRIVELEYQEPSPITPELLEDVINQEERMLRKHASKEFTDEAGGLSQFEIIERKVIRLSLNGYKVSKLGDQKATTVGLSVYFSLTPSSVTKQIKRVLSQNLSASSVEFHSFSLSAFSVLREMFPNDENFLIIHVGGETTEILMARNDVIDETLSFPLGRNFMVRRLLDRVPNLSPHLAFSLLKSHTDERSRIIMSPTLKTVLIEAEDDWLRLFKDSVGELSNKVLMPKLALVMSGEEAGPIFTSLLRNGGRGSVTNDNSVGSFSRVEEITNENFSGHCDWVTRAVPDQFLLIESIFAGRLFLSHSHKHTL